MTKNTKHPPKSASTALTPVSMFGPPPVLGTENIAQYNALLSQVTKCVKPRNILEKIWVRDVVDLTWEVFRWRRLGTDLLRAEALADCIDRVEKIEQLAMTAEARRSLILREIERYRSSFAYGLRQTLSGVEDGKFKVIEHRGGPLKHTGGKRAA